MDIPKNKSSVSINSVSDTESDASQFESFHSYDSPQPSPLRKPSPPPRYEMTIERGRKVEDHEEVGEERRQTRGEVAVVSRGRSTRGAIVKKVELVCRVCEVALCLASFLLMISNKTKGWAGDSYYRYFEFRYCAAVCAIGFIYSGLQACHLTLVLIRGKHLAFHRMRYRFNFVLDQIIAYLLISASSSGATRVEVWVSNWGGDEFTKLACTSITMSFLAFAAFSISSLVSAYNLSI